MELVDVVLLTKNSERTLEKCLTSIYLNVPVRKLIVVDGHSNDGTLDILRAFNERYKNIVIIQDYGTRSTARQKGIGKVETEWFMFVDSDVELCGNWFKKAKNYIGDDVGAIWGIEVWSDIQNPMTLKWFLLITRKIFEIRGGTHDTLIRRDAIKNIKIPSSLHVFEDAYISQWIKSKGYRVIACYNPYCIHYRPREVWTLRGSLNLIIDAIRCGKPTLILKLIFAYGFYTAYSIHKMLSNKMNFSNKVKAGTP
ncbi:MAG: glycosyltransferase family A protein [Candidatus Bathyarchaeia archaeon]